MVSINQRTDTGRSAEHPRQVRVQLREAVPERQAPAAGQAGAQGAGVRRTRDAVAGAAALDRAEVAVLVAGGALRVLLLPIAHAHLVVHAPRPDHACRMTGLALM